MKKSKQIIGPKSKKSKEIIGPKLKKSKEIIGPKLKKSKEIIGPKLKKSKQIIRSGGISPTLLFAQPELLPELVTTQVVPECESMYRA